MIKKIFFTIILLISTFFVAYAQNSTVDSLNCETFTFTVDKGKVCLKGSLNIPLNYRNNQPFVVFVSPPQPKDRNYGGLYTTIADKLGRAGIASLRYDNRSYSDSTNLPRNPDKYTMFDNAADAHDAILALRKDKRFEQSIIGIIGHSEGGAAAAIESSRNKDVSFLIVMSTIGIPGVDLAFSQIITGMGIILDQMPTNQRNSYVSSQNSTIQLIAKETNNKLLKRHLIRESRAAYLSTPPDEILKRYGKQTLQQVIDNTLNLWMRPRLMEYFRFKPVLYYSKIGCPVLATFGKKDEKLDWRANSEGLEKIFLDNKKSDYTILALDSLNHNYETVRSIQIQPWMSRSKNFKKDEFGVGFQELCHSMIDWINSQHAK